MKQILLLAVLFLVACSTTSVRQDAEKKAQILPVSLDPIFMQKDFVLFGIGQRGTFEIPKYISESMAQTKSIEEIGIASSFIDVWVAVDASLKNKDLRSFHKRAFPYSQQDSGSLLISKYILSTWGTARPVYPFGIYAKSGMGWNFRKENLWDRLINRLEVYAPSKDKAFLKNHLEALQACKLDDTELKKTEKSLAAWIQRIQSKITWQAHREALQMFPQVLALEKQKCQNMAESIWALKTPLLQHKILALGEYEDVDRWKKDLTNTYSIAAFAAGGKAYLDPQTLELEDLPSLKSTEWNDVLDTISKQDYFLDLSGFSKKDSKYVRFYKKADIYVNAEAVTTVLAEDWQGIFYLHKVSEPQLDLFFL